MRTKKPLLAVCGLLLFAACGSDNGHAEPAPLVEKSAAIASGDTICKQLTADVTKLVSDFHTAHPNPTDADSRDFLVNTLLPRVDLSDGALHRIGEPTKDRAAFDSAISAFDKDVSALKESVGADPVKVATSPIVLFNSSAKLFTDYGFKECGKK